MNVPKSRMFPPEFCDEFYRSSYRDLEAWDAVALWNHYISTGREEGRLASPAAIRETFIDGLAGQGPALEIGPFDCPVLKGSEVKYFDVLSSQALRERAFEHGRSPDDVPDLIHYVSGVGDLSIIDETFGLVLSSHAIEHQPDLISHLQQVERLLRPGAPYAVIIPDCCYCFDHFISPSTVSSVIEAHMERRTVHKLASVINHYAYTTHNDAMRHWSGDHGSFEEDIRRDRIKKAVADWAEADAYIDVHAWQFTPRSFGDLINTLTDLGYFNLRAVRVYDTPKGRLEFCAIIEKTEA